MKRFCAIAFLLAFLWALPSFADSKQSRQGKDAPPAPPPHMTEDARVALLRGLAAERVYVRKFFPRGKKGLTLSATGKLSPDERGLAELVAQNGAAAKPGDMAVITHIEFTERSIVFEINGGPKKRGHWYQHLQIGMNGGMTSVAPPNASADALGSFVALEFPQYIPELSPHEVRSLLQPVFDFNSHSSAEAYSDSLPPKIREAIKSHNVLVGMDRDMVTAALGKPQNKVREKDESGTEYEEWIFGAPPQDVQFVRFVGDQVVRLEIMKVDGTKIVRTEREVDSQPRAVQASSQPASPAPSPQAPPSLRRPGEVPQDTNRQQPGGGPVLMPQDAGPDNPPSPNAPNSPNPGNGPVAPPPGPPN
jgi:hypothetical protein